MDPEEELNTTCLYLSGINFLAPKVLKKHFYFSYIYFYIFLYFSAGLIKGWKKRWYEQITFLKITYTYSDVLNKRQGFY